MEYGLLLLFLYTVEAVKRAFTTPYLYLFLLGVLVGKLL